MNLYFMINMRCIHNSQYKHYLTSTLAKGITIRNQVPTLITLP